MTRVYVAKNVIDAVTPPAANAVIINKSCYVTSVVVTARAGTQTLKIQDRGQTTPAIPIKVLVGPLTFAPATIGTPIVFQLYNDCVLMIGGVDVLTTGTGTADVWVCAVATDEGG